MVREMLWLVRMGAAPQVLRLNYEDPSSAEANFDKRNTQVTKGTIPKSGITYPCVIRMSMASMRLLYWCALLCGAAVGAWSTSAMEYCDVRAEDTKGDLWICCFCFL